MILKYLFQTLNSQLQKFGKAAYLSPIGV